MFRMLIAAGFTALLVLPALPAPAPKEDDKPLPPATPAQRAQSANNLKQIGLAIHNYESTVGHLPANIVGKDGKAILSWRVVIAPYSEAGSKLKLDFKVDEPWDSEHNKKMIDKMPKFFAPPRGKADPGMTYYQMFSGSKTLLGPEGKGITFASVTDGLSNTFMAVEAEKPVIWTKPDDLPFDGKTVPKLGGMFDGNFHALFGDGSTRFLPKGLDPEVLRRLVDRQDGHVIDLDAAIKKAEGKD